MDSLGPTFPNVILSPRWPINIQFLTGGELRRRMASWLHNPATQCPLKYVKS